MVSSNTEKMKVGISIGEHTPTAGGAYTLIDTIKKDIQSSQNADFDYVFLYSGDSNNYSKKVDDFQYINLNFKKNKKSSRSLRQKIKLKIKSKLDLDTSGLRENNWETIITSENIDIIWFVNIGNCDINMPYIYTVWDLAHRTASYFPEVSRTGWLWKDRENLYKKMFFKASYILTGNETGKKEILTNYPMHKEKIRIVPFPVASFCYGEEEKPKLGLPNKYFFYPAQFWPHKNHICILESLRILKEKQNTTAYVVFTGSDKGNKQYVTSKVKEYGLEEQVIFTGFLSEQELKYMYTHAQAMIFASLLGPNNMPPIEATYLNCPVIITDLEGHKEQLEDTALYFDGYNPNELALHMKSLQENKKIRNTLIEKQQRLAKKFENISYFSEVHKILTEFSRIRKTWGKNYVHL